MKKSSCYAAQQISFLSNERGNSRTGLNAMDLVDFSLPNCFYACVWMVNDVNQGAKGSLNAPSECLLGFSKITKYKLERIQSEKCFRVNCGILSTLSMT